MYNNDNTLPAELQPLCDVYTGKGGKQKCRPWREKKMANELLAMAYDSINPSKAARLRECGKFLMFRVYADGTRKLDKMASCRVRLCPICTWRRSLVNFANNMQIVQYVQAQQPRGWLLGTFTLRRCTGAELAQQIDLIMYAYKKLLLNTRVKAAVKGAYRGVEITHDCNQYITPDLWQRKRDYFVSRGLQIGDANPQFDTYHVHIHVIFDVTISYFKNKVYLTQADWAAAWQQAAGVDYTPVVDIRRIQPKDGNSIAGAIAEVSKYATKSADYLQPEDWDLTVDTVKLLDSVLNNRRFVSYSGELLKAQKALKLKDADNADLTHITGEYGADNADNQNYKTETYFWYTGYRQYGKRRGE